MISIRHLFVAFLSLLPIVGFADPIWLLNVSYDPTRKLYQEFKEKNCARGLYSFSANLG
jgi:ABC-type sulfate transport system substrate-binding protein